MATYPALDIDYNSTRKPIENKKIDVAADGTLRSRKDYSKTVYEFSIVHPLLSTTDKDSIQTFYDANDSVTFTFNYAADSADYTLIFKGEPEAHQAIYNKWNVTMKAIGTKV